MGLSDKMSLVLLDDMDKTYASPDIINRNTLRFSYWGLYEDYLYMKYRRMDAVSKKQLLAGYASETFGSYARFLLAPDYMQPLLFGQEFLNDIENMYNSFDHDKMLAYLKENYPATGYISAIEKRLAEKAREKPAADTNEEEITFLSNDTITTLSDVAQLDALKGNYIYVDLWASWCMPCIKAFQYKDDLAALFSKYNKNIVKLYLSIDEDNKDEVWRKSVANFQLKGYNLRTSQALYDHISQQLYKGGSVAVPRYLLIGADGTILHDRLPDPGKMKQLEQVLDGILVN